MTVAEFAGLLTEKLLLNPDWGRRDIFVQGETYSWAVVDIVGAVDEELVTITSEAGA